MTLAKFVPNPAESHGLTDRILDPHFDALAKGQPVGLVPALVLLKPHAYGGNITTRGTQRHVKYEIARCEPITDPGDRENAMWQVQALYEARTSTGSQRPLPLGMPTEERRQALMERIEDRSKELGLTGGELEQRWRTHFGFPADGEKTDHMFEIPGDYRKAGVTQLLEFAITIDAEKGGSSDVDEDDDEGDDATDADEAGTGDDPA